MEESVKRRERLKAMRMEASQAEISNSVETSAGPGCLSNPFVETSASPSALDSSATQRFDYYTDPLSAFSANKKKRNMVDTQDHLTPPSNSGSSMMQFSPSHQGPWNPTMTRPPAHQFQSNYSPSQRMNPAQAPPYNSGPHGTPSAIARPLNPTMTPPRHHFQSNYSPSQRMYQAQAPPNLYGPEGTPTTMGSPSPMHQAYHLPFNAPRADNYPSPSFGQVWSPSFNGGQGRGYWSSRSPSPGSGRGGNPSPSSGRGRGQWFAGHGMSPGQGRGGGRGLGYRSHAGGGGAERLYDKSMVEDPWKGMQPVKWKSVDAPVSCLRTHDSSTSWMPKSISKKEARVSEASHESHSQPSLAEYLAASFNEAVNDAPST